MPNVHVLMVNYIYIVYFRQFSTAKLPPISKNEKSHSPDFDQNQHDIVNINLFDTIIVFPITSKRIDHFTYFFL